MWIIVFVVAIALVFGASSDTKNKSNGETKSKRKNSWEANDDLYRTEDDFNHYDEEHDVDENGYCHDCDEDDDDIDENS